MYLFFWPAHVHLLCWYIQLDHADAEKEPLKPLSESYLLQDEWTIDISSEKENNDTAGSSSASKKVI